MPVPKRVLPEATQAVYQAQPAVGRFHRALRRPDQYALEDLFDYAQKHHAAAALTETPEIEAMLLSMLIEQHKEIRRLNYRVEKLLRLRTTPPARPGPD